MHNASPRLSKMSLKLEACCYCKAEIGAEQALGRWAPAVQEYAIEAIRFGYEQALGAGESYIYARASMFS